MTKPLIVDDGGRRVPISFRRVMAGAALVSDKGYREGSLDDPKFKATQERWAKILDAESVQLPEVDDDSSPGNPA